MMFSEKSFQLKDGRIAVLRSPTLDDASALLSCAIQCRQETMFLIHEPEEFDYTVAQEADFIGNILSAPNDIMILCFVDGVLAGSCQISRKTLIKNRHRAVLGIALLQAFWNLGIGSAMFQEMIQIGRDWGLEQLELEVFEGNERGIALYEKMGFRTAGYIPNAIHLSNGLSLKEYRMILEL